MKNIIPQDEEIKEWQNETAALEALWLYSFFISTFTVKPWFYGCPVPCRQRSYKLTMYSAQKHFRVSIL